MADNPFEALPKNVGEQLGGEIIEAMRRHRARELNSRPGFRAELQARYGTVWSPDELAQDFEVVGFAAPYVVVRRRSDGTMGSVEFQHDPRFYFNFEPDQPI